MTTNLHSLDLTKLRQPRATANAVERARLSIQLESARERLVSLVTAPAGFGKTWLVADWLDTHPDVAQCWITLDRYDNDPIRLWLHIIEAIGLSASPNASEEAAALIRSSDEIGLATVVDALAAGIANCGDELFIVVDDAHVLESTEVLNSLDQFLGLLPRNAHVVFVGRHDPALPLAKWRLSGHLVEIRTADLRCSLEESQAIVAGALGLDLDAAVVAEIQNKAMGWLAGIRLAAVATAASGDASKAAAQLPSVGTVDGAYATVSEYLVEAVIDDLEERDRRFLLDTSILGDLSGPLCNAVSGVEDSTEVLERLARSGMFVSPMGETDVWYRYHDLFRDALRLLLHRQSPGREHELHSRAAHWFREHGDAVKAIRHAAKSGQPDLAAQWLIEASRNMLEEKQYDTMCTLFGEVDAISKSPSALFLAAWCFPVLYCNSGIPLVDQIHERASRRLHALTAAENELLRDEWMKLPEPFESSAELLRGIDATLAHRRGDTELALSALDSQGGAPSASGWVEAAAGEMLIYSGRYAEGLQLMAPWADFALSSRNPMVGNTAYTLTTQAWARLGQGNLSQAELLADRAIQILRVAGLGGQPQAAVATVPLAWVALERGELDRAESVIVAVLERVAEYGEVPAYVYAETLLARIHNYQGDPDKANVTLDEALVLPSGRTVTGHFADYIAFERCRLALINDDLPGAQLALPDWQQRITNGAATMTEHLALTRLTIASQGDSTKLLKNTPDGIDVTSTHQIELRKLNAYHALQTGDETTALDYLVKAMEIAIHTGHRQTFLDDYPTFGGLIENAAAMSGLRLTHPGRSPQTPLSTDTAPTLVEPLTDRELEFLRLLPTHLTYKEIGEQLYVSTNTVKSYLKNIYRKLEADSRNTAVAHAHTLGLID